MWNRFSNPATQPRKVPEVTERDPIMLTVPEALEEYRRGRFVIITDDEDRENEGDLVMAAQFVTPDAINFMAKYGRGLICCSITEERVEELKLPMMVERQHQPVRHAVHGLGRGGNRA